MGILGKIKYALDKGVRLKGETSSNSENKEDDELGKRKSMIFSRKRITSLIIEKNEVLYSGLETVLKFLRRGTEMNSEGQRTNLTFRSEAGNREGICRELKNFSPVSKDWKNGVLRGEGIKIKIQDFGTFSQTVWYKSGEKIGRKVMGGWSFWKKGFSARSRSSPRVGGGRSLK